MPTTLLSRATLARQFLAAVITTMATGLGCSSDSEAATGPDPTPSPTSVPAEFTGTWYAGNVSGVIFNNPNTGQWSSPSGTGVTYTFNRDGTYEKGVLLQSSLYGCTSSFLAYQRGTVRVSGAAPATFELTASYARIKSVDNCVTKNNYEKDDPYRSETILVQRGRDEYNNEVLQIRSPDGHPSAFHRR